MTKETAISLSSDLIEENKNLKLEIEYQEQLRELISSQNRQLKSLLKQYTNAVNEMNKRKEKYERTKSATDLLLYRTQITIVKAITEIQINQQLT